MKALTLVTAISGLAVALACTVPAPAQAETYFGFQIGVSNARRAPRVVYRRPPPVIYEPEAQVYVVNDDYNDYDTFRYGGYYYVLDDDYWYRSRSYRGPFVAIDVRSVPRPIFRVPQQRWHHYPAGLHQYYANRDYRGGYRDAGRNDGRWHNGRGRGRGHNNNNHDNGRWNNGHRD